MLHTIQCGCDPAPPSTCSASRPSASLPSEGPRGEYPFGWWWPEKRVSLADCVPDDCVRDRLLDRIRSALKPRGCPYSDCIGGYDAVLHRTALQHTNQTVVDGRTDGWITRMGGSCRPSSLVHSPLSSLVPSLRRFTSFTSSPSHLPHSTMIMYVSYRKVLTKCDELQSARCFADSPIEFFRVLPSCRQVPRVGRYSRCGERSAVRRGAPFFCFLCLAWVGCVVPIVLSILTLTLCVRVLAVWEFHRFTGSQA